MNRPHHAQAIEVFALLQSEHGERSRERIERVLEAGDEADRKREA